MTASTLPEMPPDLNRTSALLFVRPTIKQEYDALRSYTEDCLARLRVAQNALEFYADKEMYLQHESEDDVETPEIWDDKGEAAREALAAIGPLPEEKP